MSQPDPTLVPTPDPFESPTGGWRRVSPRLATARRVVVLVPWVLLGLGAVVALAVAGWREAAFGGVVVTVLGVPWLWWLVGRQVRAKGYCLREADLLVVSGIMLRRLVVVPFGRMQLVDVTRGPVDRWFGLATVQLHTAAATTDATIPGLTPGEAAELRDRLARLGEQRSAGL